MALKCRFKKCHKTLIYIYIYIYILYINIWHIPCPWFGGMMFPLLVVGLPLLVCFPLLVTHRFAVTTLPEHSNRSFPWCHGRHGRAHSCGLPIWSATVAVSPRHHYSFPGEFTKIVFKTHLKAFVERNQIAIIYDHLQDLGLNDLNQAPLNRSALPKNVMCTIHQSNAAVKKQRSIREKNWSMLQTTQVCV